MCISSTAKVTSIFTLHFAPAPRQTRICPIILLCLFIGGVCCLHVSSLMASHISRNSTSKLWFLTKYNPKRHATQPGLAVPSVLNTRPDSLPKLMADFSLLPATNPEAKREKANQPGWNGSKSQRLILLACFHIPLHWLSYLRSLYNSQN